ncbi:MAG TPA: non-ribosomal peptide synthetase [Jatrophihabitans sp.]|nr:non-ribosomal peptide synthetase [Jatrophihabitans sp.]
MWSGTAGTLYGEPVDSNATINDLFQHAVQQFPTRPAVRDERRSLTFAELAAARDELASRLAEVGVSAGDVVVIAVPRSTDEVIAILAVLSLGAAYTALEPANPEARQAALLTRLVPGAIIGSNAAAHSLARLAPDSCPLVPVELPAGPADPDSQRARSAAVSPDSPAYISFTSGSTGGPKGVIVSHRGVVRLVRGASYARTGPGERWLRMAPLAFDASTLELFCPLATGAEIEVFPDGPIAPIELASFLHDRQVTVAWLTASLFRLVITECPSAFDGLRQLVTGGDVVPASQVRGLLERTKGSLVVTNGYGPTENTTFTTTHTFTDPTEVRDTLPIGRPVAGTWIRVLRQDGQPARVDEPGELYVGGGGLALGYLGEPDHTAFLRDPATSERLYRTGDLVRLDRSGVLFFLGRLDRQVKIGGHRIEPAEVEAVLTAQHGVRDAVVFADNSAGSARLAAVVVPVEDDADLLDKVRGQVRTLLPERMVPSSWYVRDSLPVTASGKLDVQALVTGSDHVRAETSEAVHGAELSEEYFQSLVSRVWADVLRSDDFGIDDAFFDIGGDSLGAASVHTRLSELLPESGLRMVDVFMLPTARALASHLKESAGDRS